MAIRLRIDPPEPTADRSGRSTGSDDSRRRFWRTRAGLWTTIGLLAALGSICSVVLARSAPESDARFWSGTLLNLDGSFAVGYFLGRFAKWKGLFTRGGPR